MKNQFRQFLRRLGIFTLFLGLLFFSSYVMLISPPIQYRYTDSDWDEWKYSPSYNTSQANVLLDQHSHTLYSADGQVSPLHNLLWHMSMGFNAMVISDHNTFDGAFEIRDIARNDYNDTIKVLIGVEWTTDSGHYNFIFPPNITAPQLEGLIRTKSYLKSYTLDEITDIVQNVHDLGGLVVVNHYPWSQKVSKTNPTRDELLTTQIDYFEIVNGDTYDLESEQFSDTNNLGKITGTDMHTPEAAYAWTLLNISDYSEEAIFAALQRKQTQVLYEPLGSSYPVYHQPRLSYSVLYPFLGFAHILKDIYEHENYVFEYVALIMLLYVAFTLYEAINIWGIPWIANKKAKKARKARKEKKSTK